MTESRDRESNPGTSGALNQETSFVAHMQTRTVGPLQDFFAVHLQPGMRLLDCGCGPGALTIGFAALVHPGEVVGLDMDPRILDLARKRAAESRVENVRYELGDVHALPYPDASFDAVWAQALLTHLPAPLAALREMRRVLRSGGLAAINDEDLSVAYMTPETPLMREAAELTQRVRDLMGGSPFYAREQRRLLLDAGFDRAAQSAALMTGGNANELERERPFIESRLRGYANAAAAQGWIDQEHVDEIMTDMEHWFERPDAFLFRVVLGAIGFVDA
jgi:ubiquinone/menaquinone biosynthesis C-methylase UbiE